MNEYRATDDDLPDFFRGGPAPTPKEVDPRRQAEIAVERIYPALLGPKQQPAKKPYTKASLDAETKRKVYVRHIKRATMSIWLWALSEQGAFDRMNPWERGFAQKLLDKFEKWGVERIKWITQAQFDVTKSLAVKYLRIPNKEMK